MKSILLIFLLFPLFIAAQIPSLQSDSIITNLKNHVLFLTSPELKGRGIDNEGADLAADYIQKHFKKFALARYRFYNDSTYLQSFIVNDYSSLTPESFVQVGANKFYSGRNFVSIKFGGSAPSGILNDLHYFNIQKTKNLNFVLHSIEGTEHSKGNIRMVTSEKEFNSACKALSMYELYLKTDPLFVLNTLGDSIIFDIVASPALSKAFKQAQEKDSVTVFFKRELQALNCKNVLGYIPSANKTDSFIVFTAHYDHLGEINGNLYPGANDNASGVAVILELARIASKAIKNGWQPDVNLVFIAFSAEEVGLLGSGYFVNNPPFELSKIKIVINLDMVGGIAKNSVMEPEKLYLYHSSGVDQEIIRTIISQSEKLQNLTFDLNGKEKYLKASDQASFIKKGIPSIFIFSGVDKNCHKPTDTIDFLSFPKMTDLTLVLKRLIENQAFSISNSIKE